MSKRFDILPYVIACPMKSILCGFDQAWNLDSNQENLTKNVAQDEELRPGEVGRDQPQDARLPRPRQGLQGQGVKRLQALHQVQSSLSDFNKNESNHTTFQRTIIRHSDLVTADASVEYLKNEGEKLVSNQMHLKSMKKCTASHTVNAKMMVYTHFGLYGTWTGNKGQNQNYGTSGTS